MQFTKENQMDKIMKKRKTWTGKGMCWKGVVTLEIEDLSENQMSQP